MNTEEKKKVEEGYTIKGADEALVDKANASFTVSEDATAKQAKSDNALKGYESIATGEKIVSDKTWGKINSTFKTPAAVTEADNYLKGALSKIQSGKTSYSDQVRDMMSQIQNRDKFSYDVDSDPLFQQALASAMNSGRSAMQDTIGQASALTGGYGSSYATSAANQTYNSFIEDAYNNLPQYYQMALEAYQMEGDEMYRQLDMLNTADATEYARMLNAYDATYQHRNQMYNEAYQQHRDGISDAFASANLQINEHGQLVSDAFNLYSAYSNEANTAYNREYQQWSDSIAQAWKMIGAQNQDYWATENFNEEQRQYNETLAENKRQHDENLKEEQRQYDNTMTFNKEQAGKEWEYKYAALAQDESQFNRTMEFNKTKLEKEAEDDLVKNSELSTTEINALKDVYVKAGGGDAGDEAVYAHLVSLGKGNLSNEMATSLETILKETSDRYFLGWHMYDADGSLSEGADDTTNWFGKTDNNDVYIRKYTIKDEDGKDKTVTETMTYKQLAAAIDDSDLTDDEKEIRKKALKNMDKK